VDASRDLRESAFQLKRTGAGFHPKALVAELTEDLRSNPPPRRFRCAFLKTLLTDLVARNRRIVGIRAPLHPLMLRCASLK
jgi:hypothetical protein